MQVISACTFQLVVAMAAALLASKAEASKEFVAMLPNGANVPGAPAIGHSDNTGDSDATNAFGDAFATAGKEWTTELCQADTDGDGQTNGQELGDPCCEWVMSTNDVVLWSTGVSHPGDASKTSDASLWDNVTCGSSSTSDATSGSSSAATAGSSVSAGSSSPAPSTASSTSDTAMTRPLLLSAVGVLSVAMGLLA